MVADYFGRGSSVRGGKLILTAILVVLLLAAIISFIRPLWLGSTEVVPVLDEAAKTQSCRSASIGLIKPERIDIGFLNQLTSFCYDQVRGDDLLQDFSVRKLDYMQQALDTKVILWMVVAITISGVLLASLQLLAAYRLAMLGKADFVQGDCSQIKIDPTSISLKSSVTGLLILAISLAFFIVYVKWVYPIELYPDPEASASNNVGATTSLLPGPVGTNGKNTTPGAKAPSASQR
jgi:hypothetical protein